jgi:hypothetical protein
MGHSIDQAKNGNDALELISTIIRYSFYGFGMPE